MNDCRINARALIAPGILWAAGLFPAKAAVSGKTNTLTEDTG